MKLSRKFLSDYIDIPSDVTTRELAEDMTNVCNEYDYCEKLIPATNLVICPSILNVLNKAPP